MKRDELEATPRPARQKRPRAKREAEVLTVEAPPAPAQPVVLAHIQDEELLPVSDEAFEAQLQSERRRRRALLSAASAAVLATVALLAWPTSEATPLDRSGTAPVQLEAQPLTPLESAWQWPAVDAPVPPLRPAIEERVDVSARLQRSERLYAAGRLREAAELLEEAVALAPENFEAWLLRGEVQFDLGARRLARDSADRAAALMPLDGRVQLFLASLALDAGDLPSARAALERVLAIDADSNEGVEARAILQRLDRRARGRQG